MIFLLLILHQVDILLDAQDKPWTWVLGEADGQLPYKDMVRQALKAEEDEQRLQDEADAKAAKVRTCCRELVVHCGMYRQNQPAYFYIFTRT